MCLEKPIFITGSGRNGSSAFARNFTRHPRIAYLSVFCRKFPAHRWINQLLMRAIDLPLIGGYFTERAHTDESYPLWDYHCPGFSHPCRDFGPEDVTVRNRKAITRVLPKMLTNKRNRLMIKVTGWPRLGFFRELFDDAKFIHLVRDGRAVANSFINVEWWVGWRGTMNWRCGELTPAQRELWERYNRSFIVLAGIQWMIFMDAMENARKYVKPENFMQLKFQDTCSDPVGVFRKVLEFCELEWSHRFEKRILAYPPRNTNHKWKKDLTPAQQKALEEVTHEYLQRYGYV